MTAAVTWLAVAPGAVPLGHPAFVAEPLLPPDVVGLEEWVDEPHPLNNAATTAIAAGAASDRRSQLLDG